MVQSKVLGLIVFLSLLSPATGFGWPKWANADRSNNPFKSSEIQELRKMKRQMVGDSQGRVIAELLSTNDDGFNAVAKDALEASTKKTPSYIYPYGHYDETRKLLRFRLAKERQLKSQIQSRKLTSAQRKKLSKLASKRIEQLQVLDKALTAAVRSTRAQARAKRRQQVRRKDVAAPAVQEVKKEAKIEGKKQPEAVVFEPVEKLTAEVVKPAVAPVSYFTPVSPVVERSPLPGPLTPVSPVLPRSDSSATPVVTPLVTPMVSPIVGPTVRESSQEVLSPTRSPILLVMPEQRCFPKSGSGPGEDFVRLTEIAERVALEAEESENLRRFQAVGNGFHAFRTSGADWQRKTLKTREGELFLRYRNQGDGNCGLHGMDRSRRDLVDRTLSALQSSQAAEIKHLIQEDVFLYCTSGASPCEGLSENQQYEKYVKEQLSKNEEYLAFNPRHPIGTLPLAVKVFGLNVRVWKDNGGVLTQLHHSDYSSAPVQSSSSSPIDLLLDGEHYDLLVRPSDVAARQSALVRERRELSSLEVKKRR